MRWRLISSSGYDFISVESCFSTPRTTLKKHSLHVMKTWDLFGASDTRRKGNSRKFHQGLLRKQTTNPARKLSTSISSWQAFLWFDPTWSEIDPGCLTCRQIRGCGWKGSVGSDFIEKTDLYRIFGCFEQVVFLVSQCNYRQLPQDTRNCVWVSTLSVTWHTLRDSRYQSTLVSKVPK